MLTGLQRLRNRYLSACKDFAATSTVPRSASWSLVDLNLQSKHEDDKDLTDAEVKEKNIEIYIHMHTPLTRVVFSSISRVPS
jgi:hypothetical protein